MPLSPHHRVQNLNFSTGAYQNTQLFGGAYNLSWSNDSDWVYIGIKAKTTGWVALSFSPNPHGASDIAIGYVTERPDYLN